MAQIIEMIRMQTQTPEGSTKPKGTNESADADVSAPSVQ